MKKLWNHRFYKINVRSHFTWAMAFLWMIFVQSFNVVKIEPRKLVSVCSNFWSAFERVKRETSTIDEHESPNYKSDIAHRDKGNESWRDKKKNKRGTKRRGKQEGRSRKKERKARRMYFNLARVLGPRRAVGVSENFRYPAPSGWLSFSRRAADCGERGRADIVRRVCAVPPPSPLPRIPIERCFFSFVLSGREKQAISLIKRLSRRGASVSSSWKQRKLRSRFERIFEIDTTNLRYNCDSFSSA